MNNGCVVKYESLCVRDTIYSEGVECSCCIKVDGARVLR